MLDTILNNFATHVKEKITEVTEDVKKTYDFHHVEDVVAHLVDELATTILQTCVQEVLEDKEVLTALKRRGTQQGLKFHGFRTISVYVYTGRRVKIKSPWFVKKGKKHGRKKNGPNGRGVHLG